MIQAIFSPVPAIDGATDGIRGRGRAPVPAEAPAHRPEADTHGQKAGLVPGQGTPITPSTGDGPQRKPSRTMTAAAQAVEVFHHLDAGDGTR